MRLLPRQYSIDCKKIMRFSQKMTSKVGGNPMIYNMHMLDNIRIQIYKNVQNQIPETFVYMTMDAEHNETTPTIPFDQFHKYYEMFKNDLKSGSGAQPKSSNLRRNKHRYGISDL